MVGAKRIRGERLDHLAFRGQHFRGQLSSAALESAETCKVVEVAAAESKLLILSGVQMLGARVHHYRC